MGNVLSRSSALLPEQVQLQPWIYDEGMSSVTGVYARIRKKARIVLLPPVFPSPGVSMELDEVIQEVPLLSSLELSFAGMETYQKLLKCIKLVCKIYDVPFQELLDAVEQQGEEITVGLMLFLEILSAAFTGFQSPPHLSRTS